MPYKSPAYRWYPNDVLNSRRVGEMTASEECWYRRALDFAWINEGIPSDPVKLARVIGKGCTKGGARVVLEMFQKTDDPNRLINDRQEAERHKQQEWSAKSSAGGKASARKPKNPKGKTAEHHSSTKATANGQPKGNIPFPIPIPSKPSPIGEVQHTATKPEPKTLLPADYRPPPDFLDWARIEAPDLNLESELDEFIIFWRDIATKNNKRTLRGWNATWKARLKEQQSRSKRNGTNNRNGFTKRTDLDVIAESAEFYKNYPAE